MLGHNRTLSRRLHALERQTGKAGGGDEDELPQVLNLPPLVLPRGAYPTDEQLDDGVPPGYVLFVFPEKEKLPWWDPDTGEQQSPPAKPTTRTYLRTAFRQDWDTSR
jgi:hypothetical protein